MNEVKEETRVERLTRESHEAAEESQWDTARDKLREATRITKEIRWLEGQLRTSDAEIVELEIQIRDLNKDIISRKNANQNLLAALDKLERVRTEVSVLGQSMQW